MLDLVGRVKGNRCHQKINPKAPGKHDGNVEWL